MAGNNASLATIKIGSADVDYQKWDGATAGLVSGAVKLANWGIKISGNGVEVIVVPEKEDDNAKLPQEKKRLFKLFKPYKKQKAALAKTLTELHKALNTTRTDSKYNLTEVLRILQIKGLTMEQLAELAKKDLSGDELIAALLEMLDLDPKQFEKEYVAAFKELESMSGVITSQNIEGNLAYKTFASDPTKLIPKFQAVINTGSKKLQLARKVETDQKKAQKLAAQEAEEAKAAAKKQAEIAELLDAARNGTSTVKEVQENYSVLKKALGPKEDIYSFTYNGMTYVVVVKENNGKYHIISKNLPDKFKKEVDVKNGKLLVDVNWSLDAPQLQAFKETTQPAGFQGDKLQAWKHLYDLSGGTLTLDVFNKIWKDEKITKEEWTGDLKFSAPSFHVVNKNMNTGGAEEDDIVDLAELGEAKETIYEYADLYLTHIPDKQERTQKALKLYLVDAKSFENKNFAAAKQARKQIQGEIAGINGDNYETILSDANYHSNIIYIVGDSGLLSIEDQVQRDTAVASLIIRVVEASRFDKQIQQEVFGITKEITLPAFEEDKYTAENIIKWLKGGMPLAGGESKVAKQTEEEEEKIIAKEAYLKKYEETEIPDSEKTGPKRAKVDAAKEELKALFYQVKSGNKKAAEKLWMKYVEKAQEYRSIQGDPQLLSLLLEGFKTAEMYGNAIIIANAMGPNRENELAKIAIECLKSGNQQIREKAVAILKEIKADHQFTEQEGAQILEAFLEQGVKVDKKGMSAGQLAVAVEKATKKHADIWAIEKEYVSINEQAPVGQRVNLPEGVTLKGAIEAVNKLNAIIKAPETNAYNKAYAQYIQGILLYAISKKYSSEEKADFGNGIQISGKELRSEAMYALRNSWEAVRKGRETDVDLFDDDFLKDIFGKMVYIVDGVKHIGTANTSEQKKLQKELGGFIPDYDEQFTGTQIHNAKQLDQRTPKKYKKTLGKGVKDSYASFESKFGTSPAKKEETTVANAPKKSGKPGKKTPGKKAGGAKGYAAKVAKMTPEQKKTEIKKLEAKLATLKVQKAAKPDEKQLENKIKSIEKKLQILNS